VLYVREGECALRERGLGLSCTCGSVNASYGKPCARQSPIVNATTRPRTGATRCARARRARAQEAAQGARRARCVGGRTEGARGRVGAPRVGRAGWHVAQAASCTGTGPVKGGGQLGWLGRAPAMAVCITGGERGGRERKERALAT
jgi:hypothetical protein